MYNLFPSNNNEVPPRLSVHDSKIAVPFLGFRATPRQQQCSDSFLKTARHYCVLVQVQSHQKTAKPDVPSSSNPRRSHSAGVLSQELHHQRSRRSLPSSFSASVTFGPLLVFHVDDGIVQRSVLLLLQVLLPLSRQMHEIKKFSEGLLRQTIRTVQGPKYII